MTLPAPTITRFRDTLQTSDHLLQPLTPANDTLLPRNLRRLAKNAFIELKSSESNHEVPYNDRIVSFLEELVPQADIRFSTYRFKLAKSDTKGLRDVNVEGGLDYAETKAYRDHRDWFERGKTVLDEVSVLSIHPPFPGPSSFSYAFGFERLLSVSCLADVCAPPPPTPLPASFLLPPLVLHFLENGERPVFKGSGEGEGGTTGGTVGGWTLLNLASDR